jgi:hypothetical protein
LFRKRAAVGACPDRLKPELETGSVASHRSGPQLQAIDRVRSDVEWQTYLRELYNVHLKFCQLGDEKREELNRDADPHNVTPREIAIDDKYDAKFKEVQATLQTLYYRQADLQKRFGANPFAFQFSIVQTSRIQNANCAQQWSPRYAPNDADDP